MRRLEALVVSKLLHMCCFSSFPTPSLYSLFMSHNDEASLEKGCADSKLSTFLASEHSFLISRRQSYSCGNE